MSIRALYSAATGMEALQFKLDTTANNLANAGTTAFKRTRVNFEDLFYQQLKVPGQLTAASSRTGLGTHVGLGVRVAGTQLNFEQGAPQDTGRQLDVAILGEGFFQVSDGTQTLYTRAGTFIRNDTGQLVLATADRGLLLEPSISIPADAEQISISANGVVAVQLAGQTGLQQVGEIQLTRFVNPEGLLAKGENVFAQTDASGAATPGAPGLLGYGTLRQGFLEASNTEPVRELIDLITTQRNFELNSQAIQAADQSLQVLANLRRF